MNRRIFLSGLLAICVTVALTIIGVIYGISSEIAVPVYGWIIGLVHVGGWSIGLLLVMFSGFFENGDEEVKL